MELSDDVSETVTGIEPSWNLQFFDGSVLTDDSVAALVIFVIPAAFDDPFGQKNDTVELKVTLLTEYETLTLTVDPHRRARSDLRQIVSKCPNLGQVWRSIAVMPNVKQQNGRLQIVQSAER